MLNDLDIEDRLRLMRFVCSFAWADLEVADAERDFIADLVAQLGLDEDEQKQVKGWLAHPPDPEEIDPMDIPREHRQLFLDTVLGMVAADQKIDANELVNFALFQQLLQ